MTQQVWEKCRAEIFYTKGSYLVEDDYEVRMQGETLEVYPLGGPKNLVGFTGTSQGMTGHYRLKGVFGGSATLHLSADGKLLEGSWEENGLDGMWRIHLSPSDVEEGASQNHAVEVDLHDLLAAERARVNQEWLDAFAAAGLRRASSLTPGRVIVDIKRLMLIEFNNRLRERRALIQRYEIKDEPSPVKPVFRYDQ